MTSKKPLLILGGSLVAIAIFASSYYTSLKCFIPVEPDTREVSHVVSHVVTHVTSDGSTVKVKPIIYEPLGSRTLGPAGESPADQELERIWNYVYTKQYHCDESEYLGGRKLDRDGAYDLCIERQFWPIKYNKDYKCLMYSFGVGGDFTFDDSVAERGCEVHSFDPSMDLEDGLVRSSGVVFHKTGISNEDNDSGFNGWKMRTLKTIIKELGHTNRYLDYLKVDTDKGDGSGFEDTLMKEVLETGIYKCVRQYAMEIHMPSPTINEKWLDRCRTLHRQMVQLNDVGWRLYNTTDNVRAVAYSRPGFNQRTNRAEGGVILWETSFVNFDVEGPCNM